MIEIPATDLTSEHMKKNKNKNKICTLQLRSERVSERVRKKGAGAVARKRASIRHIIFTVSKYHIQLELSASSFSSSSPSIYFTSAVHFSLSLSLPLKSIQHFHNQQFTHILKLLIVWMHTKHDRAELLRKIFIWLKCSINLHTRDSRCV